MYANKRAICLLAMRDAVRFRGFFAAATRVYSIYIGIK